MLAQHSLHHVGLHWPSLSLAHPEAWAYAVLTQGHRAWCAMRGHDLLLHFEPRRVSLTCAGCGWESPGWTLEPRKSPRLTDHPTLPETAALRLSFHGNWRVQGFTAAGYERRFAEDDGRYARLLRVLAAPLTGTSPHPPVAATGR